ncbi:hypothetical protein E2C01_101374 [Portunus trituberculatus]|uniref:Uncharacterized protein n=1 Tax=Portunus trituberculatus TaxID=210409 RepID=A0A5B7K5K0_PORTR|nr:hypothetical protein [Portunus trituberculatus]
MEGRLPGLNGECGRTASSAVLSRLLLWLGRPSSILQNGTRSKDGFCIERTQFFTVNTSREGSN